MSRWYTVDPVKVCGEQHGNVTIAYHECLCQFNYASQKRKMGILKFRHCALADEMRKQMDFDMYKIIGFSCVIFVVVAIVLFCSFKWYQQTKKNPCVGCCSCFSCLSGKKKKKKMSAQNGLCNGSSAAGHDAHDSSAGFDEHWAQEMHESLHSDRQNGFAGAANNDNVPTLQRRPTRPAPPPPKLPGAPGSAMNNVPMFEDGSLIVDDDIVCEPIPEAPPSPEPVRRPQQPDQPRSIYVDPLAFLQRPFLRLSIALSGRESNQKDGRAEGKDDDEPDALYSRVKDFVMSKVRKSGSIVSLNKGVSSNPDGASETSSKARNKYGKTASMASLHDITETELDKSYDGSKRSISLASLTAVNGSSQSSNGAVVNRSRHGSRYNVADEDVPPNQRDEYIDLEEMARKMAARLQQQQQAAQQLGQSSNHLNNSPPVITSQPLSVHALQQEHQFNGSYNPNTSLQQHPVSSHATTSSHNTSAASVPQPSPVRGKTPDFITASAYGTKPSTNMEDNMADHEIRQSVSNHNNTQAGKPSQIAMHNGLQPHTSNTSPSSSSGSVFTQQNFSSFQSDPRNSSVTALVDATGTVPISIVNPSSYTPNGNHNSSGLPNSAVVTPGALVPYAGSRLESHSSVSSVASTPAGTLKRQKPSVPPRPSYVPENPGYKSLGRPTVAPPSPKFRGTAGAFGKMGVPSLSTLPRSPLVTGKPGMVPTIPTLSLHEQQILQQQLLQQQQLQQFYLQQNPHLNPSYQQMLLQQQLLQEHTIMTPSVQQQILQEQQLFQQMLQQQQHYHMQQQYQQQLLQQQLQQGMRYRQPLSSTSSTASSASSKSLRSVHKPSHPPPPPPSSGSHGTSVVGSSMQ
ncbi:alpha-protein kinase 1 isoform X2 [Hyalella azteca]|uniref:Alpha-protein kinase 1 isoform X2 n=1 Tax=Hyalella azteca TaxID=294128 RepID=A0A8B7P8N7_HYAAZ|nr:alpha-protein kinase 1 isoform X2 [Hyalella azteca]